MIQTLAAEAQTDNSYATQYGFLLDWLEYVGLIKTDGGVVTLTGDVPVTVEDDSTPEPPAADTKTTVEEKKTTTNWPERPIVAFDFDLRLSGDDLARLTPEQISALFEGVGKVAAIKASLAQG